MSFRSLIFASLLLAVAAGGCAARKPLLSHPEKDDDSEFCLRPMPAPTGLAAATAARAQGPAAGRAGWRTAQ